MGDLFDGYSSGDLSPFNQVMMDALKTIPNAPTTLPKTTSALSDLFHELIVAPSGQQNTGSTVGNVLNYFSQMLTQKPTNQTQAVVRNGVGTVIQQPKSMFSSPIFWVVILLVVAIGIYLIKRLRK